MKARPRSVERKIAEFISSLSSNEVKRIPVRGEKGPDIQINELGFSIDVKSRKSVPATWYRISEIGMSDDFTIVKLESLSGKNKEPVKVRQFKTVEQWYDNLDTWTQHANENGGLMNWAAEGLETVPNGITVLILHRPGTPIKSSLFVFKTKDKEAIYERLNSIPNGATERNNGTDKRGSRPTRQGKRTS